MPIYEYTCSDRDCTASTARFESYRRRFDSPDPACPACQKPLTRLISAPNLIWLGSVGRFSDPTKENYDPEGFHTYRVKSTRNPDGSPEKVYIRTVQEQREFCKEEGLRMPDETNPNAVISKDGKKLQTAGISGQWV